MPRLFVLAIAVTQGCDRGSSGSADSAADTARRIPSGAVAMDSGAPPLLPSDDANDSFRMFREQALEAFARQDTAFLFRMVAEEIRTTFGPGGGIDDFKEMWGPEEPASGAWATLTRLLRLGGKHTADTMFVAPYVYASWPDSIDAFTHVAVTSAEATVHEAPNAQSAILGTASHSILRVQEWTGVSELPTVADTSWARVQLSGNRSGWLRGTDVFSPVGWRAAFARRDGVWVMILLVAGD
jgi:hypothetical protein